MSDAAARALRVRWIPLCAIGLAAGLVAALALAGAIEALVGMVLVTPVMLAVAGSILGAGQSLAIAGGLRTGLRWTAASALGLAIGMSAGVVLVEILGRALTGEQVRLASIGLTGRVLGLALIGVTSGLALGVAQWLVERTSRETLRRWTAACVVGYGLGLPIGGVAAGLLPGGLGNPLGFAVLLAIAGLVAGAWTGREVPAVVAPRSIESAV